MEQSLRLPRSELLKLIFLPGFSTREQADDVSGRGIGLDAVSQQIRELGGEVSLQSEIGVGSLFILQLPSTRTQIQKGLMPLPKFIEGMQRAIRSTTDFKGLFLLEPGSVKPEGLIFADFNKMALAISTFVAHFFREGINASGTKMSLDVKSNGNCRLLLSRAEMSGERTAPRYLPLCAEILEAHDGAYSDLANSAELRLGTVLLPDVLPELRIHLNAEDNSRESSLTLDKITRILEQCDLKSRVLGPGETDPWMIRIGEGPNDIGTTDEIEELKGKVMGHLEKVLGLRVETEGTHWKSQVKI